MIRQLIMIDLMVVLFSPFIQLTVFILGGGNFGQVVRGIYKTPQGQEVEVAVKTLKESQIASTGEVIIFYFKERQFFTSQCRPFFKVK